MYIAYHDEPSRQAAEQVRARHYPGATLVASDAGSLLFEASALRKVMRRADEWKGASYVGMVPYSIERKALGSINVERLLEGGAIDVLGLVCGLASPLMPVELPLLRHACLFHGPWFLAIWQRLLQGCMGFSEEVVLDDSLRGFYCNAWVARPALFRAYGRFLEQCLYFMEADPPLREMLHTKSPTYASLSARPAARYTMHPFLTERLPAFFFHVTCAEVRVCSPEWPSAGRERGPC